MIVVLGLFISSSEIIAVPTDFNLKILNRRTGADAWVRISKYRTNADVHWFIDGECVMQHKNILPKRLKYFSLIAELHRHNGLYNKQQNLS